MMITSTATKALHSLVLIKNGSLPEEENHALQNEIDNFFSQFGHSEKEVFEMFDDLADDILNKNYPENQRIRLYDYDSFLYEYVEEDVRSFGRDYKEGFDFVFDSLESDEQRKFIFHRYIKHADRFDSNNVREWQNQVYNDSKRVYYDRCLFYILEKL